MTDSFTINLFLADKHYPLRIKRSEEALFREAGRLVNDKLAQYRNHFDVSQSGLDLKDLLAMVACQLAIESLKANQSSDTTVYEERIATLTQELDAFLR